LTVNLVESMPPGNLHKNGRKINVLSDPGTPDLAAQPCLLPSSSPRTRERNLRPGSGDFRATYEAMRGDPEATRRARFSL
jgi:hypothetical protein